MQLQQGFATGEMGAGVRGRFGLHDSNSKPLMSVLGQSRRLSDVGMSASPPTTDVSLRRIEPTLWATCDCEQSQRSSPLLDHLVSAGEQQWRHR